MSCYNKGVLPPMEKQHNDNIVVTQWGVSVRDIRKTIATNAPIVQKFLDSLIGRAKPPRRTEVITSDLKKQEVRDFLNQKPTISNILSLVDDPTKVDYVDIHQAMDIVLREVHLLQLKVALLQSSRDNKEEPSLKEVPTKLSASKTTKLKKAKPKSKGKKR